MPGLSFQKATTFCELLSATLKPQLDEFPHLTEESTSLDEVIVELKSLDTEQQALRERLKEIIRLRQDAEIRGQKLRSRIVAQIQGKLGFTNENLHAFGITPRKTTRRRRAAAAAKAEESAARRMSEKNAAEQAPPISPPAS
jgi:hypothetical protein